MSEEKKDVIALRYELEDEAPKIIAKGKGYIADKILQQAEEHNIPIYEDPTLVQLLGKLNINDKIPEQLYEIVAEVFAFIYQLDRKIE